MIIKNENVLLSELSELRLTINQSSAEYFNIQPVLVSNKFNQ